MIKNTDKKSFSLELPAQSIAPQGKAAAVLGQKGVPIIDFFKIFSAITQKYEKGKLVVAHVIVNKKKFSIEIKEARTSTILKEKLGLSRFTKDLKKDNPIKIKKELVEEIARLKIPDHITNFDGSIKTVLGVLKSIGIQIE